MAKTIASLSDEVNALDRRVFGVEKEVETIKDMSRALQESLTKIAEELQAISTDIAVIKDKQKKDTNKSFQDFVMDLGIFLIKAGILGGLAAYIINKGGF